MLKQLPSASHCVSPAGLGGQQGAPSTLHHQCAPPIWCIVVGMGGKREAAQQQGTKCNFTVFRVHAVHVKDLGPAGAAQDRAAVHCRHLQYVLDGVKPVLAR